MKRKILKTFLLLFLVIIFPKDIKALTFSVNKSADNLKPGNDVQIKIDAEVESNANLSAFVLSFSYDGSLLTYESGAGGNNVSIDGGNGRLTLKYENGEPINANFNVATLNFKVNNITQNSNSSLSLSVSSVEKAEGISARANSTNIALKALGTNPTLKSLKIPNATLSPNFNKNVTDYETTVRDVTEISIDAVATDSSSKIQISENYKNLQKGDNQIAIVVTAENGATKTYNVKVVLDTTPTDEELLKVDSTLKTLTIKGVKLAFKPDEKKYFLDVPYKTTNLDITTVATNPKAKVELGTTKLKVGKNTISIKVTSEDQSSTTIYELIVTRSEQEKQIVKTCPDTTSSKEWLIYSISMFILFSIGLVLGYLLKKFEVFAKIKNKFKSKKKEKKVEEKEEEEALSDTIEIDPKKIMDEKKKQEKAKTKKTKEDIDEDIIEEK